MPRRPGILRRASEHHVKIALVYPPTCDPTAPYLAVPDADRLPARATASRCCRSTPTSRPTTPSCGRAPLARAARPDRARALRRLERRASLDHARAARVPRALAGARRRARRARRHRRGAWRSCAIPSRFFDAEQYARAVDTIDAALRVISAAHAPLQLDFTGYRTPFALTTPEEIARDAAPERDPFDDYVTRRRWRRGCAPRGVDAVGLSRLLPRAAAARLRVRAQAQARAARACT